MPPRHICHQRIASRHFEPSGMLQCERCGELFVPQMMFTCDCEGKRVVFGISQPVAVRKEVPCPIHEWGIGDIMEKPGRYILSRQTSPRTVTINIGSTSLDESNGAQPGAIQPQPAPFLDRTATIVLSALALGVGAALLLPMVLQLALGGLLLGLLGVVVFWGLYEALARLLLWPFRDWRSAAESTGADSKPWNGTVSPSSTAPALATRRWIRRHSLLLFAAGFVCGALTVALIAKVVESARTTIIELATISGASVALASVLFYAGTAAAPSMSRWLRARGRAENHLSTERAALRAGLARALPLGVATVIVLAFAPALLQPVFTTELPLMMQAAIGLVINVIGSVVILLSEAVTKHLWPDVVSTQRSGSSL